MELPATPPSTPNVPSIPHSAHPKSGGPEPSEEAGTPQEPRWVTLLSGFRRTIMGRVRCNSHAKAKASPGRLGDQAVDQLQCINGPEAFRTRAVHTGPSGLGAAVEDAVLPLRMHGAPACTARRNAPQMPANE